MKAVSCALVILLLPSCSLQRKGENKSNNEDNDPKGGLSIDNSKEKLEQSKFVQPETDPTKEQKPKQVGEEEHGVTKTSLLVKL